MEEKTKTFEEATQRCTELEMATICGGAPYEESVCLMAANNCTEIAKYLAFEDKNDRAIRMLDFVLFDLDSLYCELKELGVLDRLKKPQFVECKPLNFGDEAVKSHQEYLARKGKENGKG